jgi:hypothetical protein
VVATGVPGDGRHRRGDRPRSEVTATAVVAAAVPELPPLAQSLPVVELPIPMTSTLLPHTFTGTSIGAST